MDPDPHYKEAIATLIVSIIALTIIIILTSTQKPSFRYTNRLLDNEGGSKTPHHF